MERRTREPIRSSCGDGNDRASPSSCEDQLPTDRPQEADHQGIDGQEPEAYEASIEGGFRENGHRQEGDHRQVDGQVVSGQEVDGDEGCNQEGCSARADG